MAMRLSVAPRGRTPQALRPRVAQPALRPSAGRPRTVRTQAFWDRQPEVPASEPEQAVVPATPAAAVSAAPATADLTLLLGTAVAVITIITSVQSIITTSNSALESKLTASNSALESKLTASISLIIVKLDTIGKDVAANTSKLDAVSVNVQAQQVQTALMQGQVAVLRKVVTGTPTSIPTQP